MVAASPGTWFPRLASRRGSYRAHSLSTESPTVEDRATDRNASLGRAGRSPLPVRTRVGARYAQRIAQQIPHGDGRLEDEHEGARRAA
jgi:hypothetical protein